MKTNYESYPHPVLKNGDDVDGEFRCKITAEMTKELLKVHPEFLLTNSDIEGLIRTHKAYYLIHAECRKTYYREAFSFSETKPLPIEIPADKVKDDVELTGYIVAGEEITDYSSDTFHSDYAGEKFTLRKGDIIGTAGKATIIAEKDYDSLFSIGGLMVIDKGRSKTMEIDFSGDRITVLLPEYNFDLYIQYKKNARWIFFSSIVMPVLMEALRTLDHEPAVSGTRWAKVLTKLKAKKGISRGDYLEAAQKILEMPLDRTFKEIKEYYD